MPTHQGVGVAHLRVVVLVVENGRVEGAVCGVACVACVVCVVWCGVCGVLCGVSEVGPG